ncbi:hypothetical protein G4O51_01405 [Candidatus Bathyarchaeota archaeon A05DMB-2]|jgi:hypothetical protein|nr:hypothetical protein [Candidatus Bathyarchaeota archaeon A05DMB-2]
MKEKPSEKDNFERRKGVQITASAPPTVTVSRQQWILSPVKSVISGQQRLTSLFSLV